MEFIILAVIFVVLLIIYLEVNNKEKEKIKKQLETRINKQATNNKNVKKNEVAENGNNLIEAQPKSQKRENVSLSPFQKQLSDSIITPEERQAQIEKAKKIEEEKKRIEAEEKRAEASLQAKEYLEIIHSKILQKAKCADYTIKGSKKIITVEIGFPYYIRTTGGSSIRLLKGSKPAKKENISCYCRPYDEDIYKYFLEALRKEAAKDNIECFPLLKITTIFNRRKEFRFPLNPPVEYFNEPFCFFRCNCFFDDEFKEKTIINEEEIKSEEAVPLSPFDE